MNRPHKMGPLADDHPVLGTQCPACTKKFVAGDYVTLVPLGPGEDPEEQKKARAGRSFNAVAACVHWACAGVPEDKTEAEPECEHRWWVFSTAMLPPKFLLVCERCNVDGQVPLMDLPASKRMDAWTRAFSAPTDPYVWKEDNDLVMVVKEQS